MAGVQSVEQPPAVREVEQVARGVLLEVGRVLAADRRHGVLPDSARLEEGEAVELEALLQFLGEIVLPSAKAHAVEGRQKLGGVAVEIDVHLLAALLVKKRLEGEAAEIEVILMRVGDEDVAQIAQIDAQVRAGGQNIRAEVDKDLFGHAEARAQADLLAALLPRVFAHAAAAEGGGNSLRRAGSQKLQSQFIHRES